MSQAPQAFLQAPVRNAAREPSHSPTEALQINGCETGDLDERLARMHTGLSRHAQMEDAAGGLFAQLVLAAPYYDDLVDTLRGDHRALAGALAALRLKLRRRQGSRRAWLAEADALSHAIIEHEELTAQLIDNALDAKWLPPCD